MKNLLKIKIKVKKFLIELKTEVNDYGKKELALAILDAVVLPIIFTGAVMLFIGFITYKVYF